jgi:hypothetical protein
MPNQEPLHVSFLILVIVATIFVVALSVAIYPTR